MDADVATRLGLFLDDLKEAIGARATAAGPLVSAYRRVFSFLADSRGEVSGAEPVRQPACVHLDDCYDGLEGAEVQVIKLARSFRAIEPALRWETHIDGRSTASLADRYADASIVGPSGLQRSRAVEIGVSVMAPETIYPDHRHPPEEVYIALSPGQWRQNDGPWNTPGVGGLIYNPGNIVHAMRSGGRPFLAIWCLPLS